MTHLPVNATSPAKALAIAEDAARTQVPAGVHMTVDALAYVEPKARPFNRVALQESGAPLRRMKTYVFGVTVERIDTMATAELTAQETGGPVGVDVDASTYFRATGAALATLAENGDALATAEIARRAAKRIADKAAPKRKAKVRRVRQAKVRRVVAAPQKRSKRTASRTSGTPRLARPSVG